MGKQPLTVWTTPLYALCLPVQDLSVMCSLFLQRKWEEGREIRITICSQVRFLRKVQLHTPSHRVIFIRSYKSIQQETTVSACQNKCFRQCSTLYVLWQFVSGESLMRALVIGEDATSDAYAPGEVSLVLKKTTSPDSWSLSIQIMPLEAEREMLQILVTLKPKYLFISWNTTLPFISHCSLIDSLIRHSALSPRIKLFRGELSFLKAICFW